MTHTQTQANGNGNLPATQQQPKAPLQVGGKVGAVVPQNIEQAFRLAQAIAASGMAPKGYGSDQNKIMVGILAGMEVGLTPMAALQSIAVINGMPSIWGDGALGLVMGSGLLIDKREYFEGQGDEYTAVCVLRRKGVETPIVGRFSIGDAKKAKLWSKPGPWQEYPKRMLTMRARAWALRDGFADVLRGLAIREEVMDMGPLVEAGDGTYAAPPPRPTRRDFDPVAAGHADLDAEFRQVAGEPAAGPADEAEQPAEPEGDFVAEQPEIDPETDEIAEDKPAEPSGLQLNWQALYEDLAGQLANLTGERVRDFLDEQHSNLTAMNKAAPELYAKLLAEANSRMKRKR